MLIPSIESAAASRSRSFDDPRSLRSIDSATAPMIMRPCNPIWTLGGTPMSTMPFDRTDDDQNADEGLQDAALAAGQASSSDDDGGNGREQAAVSDLGVAEAELRRGEDAADRVKDARDA